MKQRVPTENKNLIRSVAVVVAAGSLPWEKFGRILEEL